MEGERFKAGIQSLGKQSLQDNAKRALSHAYCMKIYILLNIALIYLVPGVSSFQLSWLQ
jgi:hypothetical protein